MIDKKDLRCKRLEETDDLSGFSCSYNDKLRMDEFIHKKALTDQKARKGVTTLFYYVPDESHRTVVGFITLAGWNAVEKLGTLPSIMIAYLGVDNHWRKKGIGTEIFHWGLAQAVRMNVCCAFAYVVWDATADHAQTFYKDKADGTLRIKASTGLGLELWRLFAVVPELVSEAKLKELS